MESYRPDRVVRALSIMASIGYFVLWGASALALPGIPLVRLLAPGNDDWTFSLEVPATPSDSTRTVLTDWGSADLRFEDARAALRIPIARMPWSIVGVLWLTMAVSLGLALVWLHHLRRILRRVRDGAPFDAQNALRLRWLGMVLLVLALFQGVAEFGTMLAVRPELTRVGIPVAMGFHIDPSLIFVALVLMVLAQIFRRGTELEQEQSLVV